MKKHQLNTEQLAAFTAHLLTEERSAGTIEKYLRDVRAFASWLGGKAVTKENVTAWKEHLREMGYAPVTINSMLAALNGFFRFMGWEECRSRFLKIQRKLFRDTKRELTRAGYDHLVETARVRGQARLALLMESICATGMRVSEVRYLTVEAARAGRAEMKRLCKYAGVAPSKVFPHNLRHLFATAFYNACRDIVRLADILGYSSIETTRIYLLTTGGEHVRQIERLGLVR